MMEFCRQRPSFGGNAATDYITAPLAQLLADAWASGLDLQDPRVSPLFSDKLGVLPPMLVQVGGAEMLHDQVVEFVSKVVSAGGGPVDLQVAEDMPHVFQLFAFVNEMPQINGYIAKAGAYIREQADHHADHAIPKVERTSWIEQGVTVADLQPIALTSGWLHREATTGFSAGTMKKRFFVLIDGDELPTDDADGSPRPHAAVDVADAVATTVRLHIISNEKRRIRFSGSAQVLKNGSDPRKIQTSGRFH